MCEWSCGRHLKKEKEEVTPVQELFSARGPPTESSLLQKGSLPSTILRCSWYLFAFIFPVYSLVFFLCFGEPLVEGTRVYPGTTPPAARRQETVSLRAYCRPIPVMGAGTHACTVNYFALPYFCSS